jgi:hypothetical protein
MTAHAHTVGGHALKCEHSIGESYIASVIKYRIQGLSLRAVAADTKLCCTSALAVIMF